jgi:hypothetical protein
MYEIMRFCDIFKKCHVENLPGSLWIFPCGMLKILYWQGAIQTMASSRFAKKYFILYHVKQTKPLAQPTRVSHAKPGISGAEKNIALG